MNKNKRLKKVPHDEAYIQRKARWWPPGYYREYWNQFQAENMLAIAMTSAIRFNTQSRQEIQKKLKEVILRSTTLNNSRAMVHEIKPGDVVDAKPAAISFTGVASSPHFIYSPENAKCPDLALRSPGHPYRSAKQTGTFRVKTLTVYVVAPTRQPRLKARVRK